MSTRKTVVRLLAVFGTAAALTAGAQEPLTEVVLNTPGLAPSRMDASGGLVEDWGVVRLALSGEGVGPKGDVTLAATRLDGVVPAAQAVSQWGPVRLTATAYRAPTYPGGTDVLTARLEGPPDREMAVTVTLDLPEGAAIGARSVSAGGRTVLTLPAAVSVEREERAWGYADEASSLPGWGRPDVPCDPAFRNIRAGLGGVPIVYHLPAPTGGRAVVAMGLCESHWASAGQRPVTCRVEGAQPQSVDPVARWGFNKPGVLLFDGRDADGDGRLTVAAAPGPGAGDRNPILNAIWVFAAGIEADPAEVAAGKLNARAKQYVDVGGANDQSLYAPGKLDFAVTLAPGKASELLFLVGCPGGEAPRPTTNTWTQATLRRAAHEVWRDWPAN